LRKRKMRLAMKLPQFLRKKDANLASFQELDGITQVV
jgi:hypothetical protein